MFHFSEKENKGQLKMINVTYEKMARSSYIVVLIKSQKGLEIVSSLQHWAKNMLEIYIEH